MLLLLSVSIETKLQPMQCGWAEIRRRNYKVDENEWGGEERVIAASQEQ